MTAERRSGKREQVVINHDCMRRSTCDYAAKCTQAAAAALEEKKLAVYSSSSSTTSAHAHMPASARSCPSSPQEEEMALDQPSFSPPLCADMAQPCFHGAVLNCNESSALSLHIRLPGRKQVESDGEEEDELNAGCVTPKGPEHQIPVDPPCPHSPHKRRKLIKHTVVSMIERNSTAASPFDEPRTSGPSNFFMPPSDLHTYPEIIRALFKS